MMNTLEKIVALWYIGLAIRRLQPCMFPALGIQKVYFIPLDINAHCGDIFVWCLGKIRAIQIEYMNLKAWLQCRKVLQAQTAFL